MIARITREYTQNGVRCVDYEAGDSRGTAIWEEGVSKEGILAALKAGEELARAVDEHEEQLVSEAAVEYLCMTEAQKEPVHEAAREYIRRGIYSDDDWDEAVIVATMLLEQQTSNLFLKMSWPTHPSSS